MRTRLRIEKVLAWARTGKPLPNIAARQRTRHHAALPYIEVPAFMDQLRKREGIPASALEFLILTAARTGKSWARSTPSSTSPKAGPFPPKGRRAARHIKCR